MEIAQISVTLPRPVRFRSHGPHTLKAAFKGRSRFRESHVGGHVVVLCTGASEACEAC